MAKESNNLNGSFLNPKALCVRAVQTRSIKTEKADEPSSTESSSRLYLFVESAMSETVIELKVVLVIASSVPCYRW